MISQFEGYQRTDNRAIFDEMFAQRKRTFHDEKGWDVQVVDGKYEIDSYDRDETVYLIDFDDQGRQVGFIRLLSTIGDHMMRGPFRSMFPDIDFRSPLIWEATRFTVCDPRVQPNGVSTAACEILLAMCRFGLEHGAAQITAVYDAPMSRFYRRCGLHNRVAGKFQTEHHGMIYVGLWDISRELEARIIRATGLETQIESHAA